MRKLIYHSRLPYHTATPREEYHTCCLDETADIKHRAPYIQFG